MNSNLFDDSLELIFNGICFFLENNQVSLKGVVIILFVLKYN